MIDNIVLNVPHSSAAKCGAIEYEDMWKLAEDVNRWTDWYTDVLFKPCPVLSPKVTPYVFPYSRFYIDAERLVNDEMERIGEGILYTDFKGNRRVILDADRERMMSVYHNYINGFCLEKGTLLIDCHSFASDFSGDVDVCIGYNEDRSKPTDSLLDFLADTFAKRGYRVAFNTPYSNAITPRHPIDYKSVMIEVNKAIYMDERTFDMIPAHTRLRETIQALYQGVLGGSL